MLVDSVPQSYSQHLLGAVYNAHAVRAILHLPKQINIERFNKAKPVKAGKMKLRVKAASALSFARLPKIFGKTASHMREF